MSDQSDNPFYDATKRASYVQYLAEGMTTLAAADRVGGSIYLMLCYLAESRDSDFMEATDRAKLQGAALRGVARGEA